MTIRRFYPVVPSRPNFASGPTQLADGNTIGRNLTAVQSRVARLQSGEWRQWSVTWDALTTSPAIGNGRLDGWVRSVDKWFDFYVEVVAGSTTTFGTGGYVFTGAPLPAPVTTRGIGFCTLWDSSGTTQYFGSCYVDDTPRVALRVPNYAGTNGQTAVLTGASPVALATGDELVAYGTYRYKE